MAISTTVLLAFAALTVDLGFTRVVRQQLENTTEAAARAGTAKLDGTVEGMAAARTAALELARANPAGGEPVVLDPNPGNDPAGDVVLGIWDQASQTFTPSTDAGLVDTVQVRARLPEVSLFFAQVALGRATTPVSAQTRAVAVFGGAGAVECYIPLALPLCVVKREGLDGLQDLTVQLNPPGVDNVGWGRANGRPNANWARDQMLDCQADGPAAIGDPVGLQNGVVTSAMQALAQRIESSDTYWDEGKWGELPARLPDSDVDFPRYGRTYEGSIMVFDGGPEYCEGSGGQFNGSKPLVGFLHAAIYDVKAGGGSAASRTIKLRLDTSTDYLDGTGAGGPDWGVQAYEPPRMVRSH